MTIGVVAVVVLMVVVAIKRLARTKPSPLPRGGTPSPDRDTPDDQRKIVP